MGTNPLPGGVTDSRRAFEFTERELVLRVTGQAPKGRPDKIVLFARKNGAGKTELCVQHPTGAAQILSTQP